MLFDDVILVHYILLSSLLYSYCENYPVDLDYKFYWIDHDKISIRENLHALLKIVLNDLILRLFYY